MRWTLAVAVSVSLAAATACSSSSTPPPRGPAAPAPAPAHAPTLADVAWLAGTWHAEGLDTHWEAVAGTLYGVAFDAKSFEVNVIGDHDEDGKPTPLTLFSLEEHGTPLVLVATSASADRSTWEDAQKRSVRLARTAGGWRGEFGAPAQPNVAFDVTPGTLDDGAALAAADRQFSAETTRDGADAWARWFAPDGSRLDDGAKITGPAAVREHIAPLLAHGALTWTPVASGIRGDRGFTLGTWTFAGSSGHTATGSYCTVWRRQADGSWKVALDFGRPAA